MSFTDERHYVNLVGSVIIFAFLVLWRHFPPVFLVDGSSIQSAQL